MGQLSDSLMRPKQNLRKQKKLELGGRSGWMTTEGRPAYHNNFGGMSTEYSIGVKNPNINNGELTHIPSIYGGKILMTPDGEIDEDAIAQIIIDNEGIDPETGRFITPGGDPEARSQGLELIKLPEQGHDMAYTDPSLEAAYRQPLEYAPRPSSLSGWLVEGMGR